MYKILCLEKYLTHKKIIIMNFKSDYFYLQHGVRFLNINIIFLLYFIILRYLATYEKTKSEWVGHEVAYQYVSIRCFFIELCKWEQNVFYYVLCRCAMRYGAKLNNTFSM